MTTITTTLVSGQNAYVGSISSRGEYSVSVNSGVQGPPGDTGVGITSANVASGNLVITLSNSAIIDAGNVASNATLDRISSNGYSVTQQSNGVLSFSGNNVVIATPLNVNTSLTIQTYGNDPTASPAVNSTTSWTFGPTGTLTLPGNSTIIADGTNVDLKAGLHGWAELQSNDGNQYMWVDDDGAYIGTNWNITSKQWIYGKDGVLTFPDSTTQNTAFTGSYNQLTSGFVRVPEYATATNIFADLHEGDSRTGVMYIYANNDVLAYWAPTANAFVAVAKASAIPNVATSSANNASYLGGIAAAQYAYANQITTYTLPAANTTTLGGVKVDGTTIVIASNTISANLSSYATTASLGSYQTTAGLSANVATLTSNNASYLGSVAAASYLVTNTAINTGNVSVTGNITLTGNLTGNTAGFTIGYLDVPQNYTNTSFTIALTDRGKHIYTANGTSQTITIANNSSVAFPIGSAISIVSQGAGTITVARGTGVTLYLAANSTSADRSIASYGMATLLKVNTDTWFINGAGVS